MTDDDGDGSGVDDERGGDGDQPLLKCATYIRKFDFVMEQLFPLGDRPQIQALVPPRGLEDGPSSRISATE